MHLATCKGCSEANLVSAARFHWAGKDRPVSDYLMPMLMKTINLLTYWFFEPSICSILLIF